MGADELVFGFGTLALFDEGFAVEHDLDDLVEEEVAGVKDQEGEFELLLKGVLIDGGKDVGYLRRVIPITWKNTVLLPSVATYVMNRKRLALVEIVKHVYDLRHLLELIHLLVTPQHLGEGHLPHSNHTPPSGISYVGALQVVVQLGEP